MASEPATEHVDTVVVGSGFGGSVAALRLAEAGRQVCVLERGRPWPPGEFPRSPHACARNFWEPDAGLHGLFDVQAFRRLDAWVAAGLGGGSLIYANVLLRKDERWFGDEEPGGSWRPWPISRADLEPHYERVERMLGATPYPVEHERYAQTPKTRALLAAGDALGLETRHPPLAVAFAAPGHRPAPGLPLPESEPNLHGRARQTCRLCAECIIGCNVGAKNTLDLTYLSAAARLGAELRCGWEARIVEPRPGGGYLVRALERPDLAEPGAPVPVAPGAPEPGPAPVARTIAADQVILAAGSLGSTALLLRSRTRLRALSPRLGERFCGNGDLLTIAVRAAEDGGARRVPRIVDPSYGTTITTALRLPDTRDGGDGPGLYVEDAGVPGELSWVVHALAGPLVLWRRRGGLTRLALASLRGRRRGSRARELAALLGDSDLSASTLPLLGMGRDTPDGKITLRGDQLDVDWRPRGSAAYLRRAATTGRQVARAMGAGAMDNPIRHLGRLITVHPLGGCAMAHSDRRGVVSPDGEVFGHPGLYVLDGAAMPGPVGPNPSLTIAAFAERSIQGLLGYR